MEHTLSIMCPHACSVTQPCLTLCNPMDCNPPDSSVHGISQARILKQVVISSSRVSSQPRPRDGTPVSCIAGGFFATVPPGKPLIQVMLAEKKMYRSQPNIIQSFCYFCIFRCCSLWTISLRHSVFNTYTWNLFNNEFTKRQTLLSNLREHRKIVFSMKI